VGVHADVRRIRGDVPPDRRVETGREASGQRRPSVPRPGIDSLSTPRTYPNLWPRRAGDAILDAMDHERDERTAPDLPGQPGETPADDAPGPGEDQEEPDAGEDFTGLPRSVFGRAMLALLAVFWIVAVIMLFTQGGK
jgi:hypothetical protein